MNRARLLISCPDRSGIVAAVARFLFEHGANIAQSDQHTTDPEGGQFFLRMEFDLPELDERMPELEREFSALGAQFAMHWRFAAASPRKRLAVFVSREPHCLLELLWQVRAGDLPADDQQALRPVRSVATGSLSPSAGIGGNSPSAPAKTDPVRASTPVVFDSSATFSWSDVGIWAGSGLMLISFAALGGLLLARRSRMGQPAV